MNKSVFLLFLVSALSIQTFAQTDLSTSLETNTRYLSSYEMKGRGHNTKESKQAAEYIKQQLKILGLDNTDYVLTTQHYKTIKDNIDAEYKANMKRIYGEDFDIEKDNIKKVLYGEQTSDSKEKYDTVNTIYNNFYVKINASGNNPNNECILIYTPYIGNGVDTIQQKELVKYSSKQACDASVLMALAQYFQANAASLKRNVIIFFADKLDADELIKIFCSDNRNQNIKLKFKINDLESPSLKGLSEDEKILNYYLGSNIENGSKILAPLLMKDTKTNSTAYYDSGMPYTIEITPDTYKSLGAYFSMADSLDYNVLAKNTLEIEKVITTFVNSDIKIQKIKTKDSQEIENDDYQKKDVDYDFSNIFGESMKQRNYFGINAMIGSNQHYYNKGRITGKTTTAFSVGLFTHLEFTKHSAIRLALNYERANANRKDGWYQSNVLSIPFGYELTTGGKNIAELAIGLGGYYDYTISGQLNKEDLDFNKTFNRHNYGLQFNWSIRFYKLIVGLYYKTSLSNIMQDKPKIVPTSGYFMLGWRF